MKGWTCFILLALAACSAGDDVADGTRGLCAEGGELNACEDTPHTAEQACWRLVDCGAMPLHLEQGGGLDWDSCVDRIERMRDPAQLLAIECIGASTCDQLKLAGDHCFRFGEN